MNLGYSIFGCISAIILCGVNFGFAAMYFVEGCYFKAALYLTLLILLLGTLLYTLIVC